MASLRQIRRRMKSIENIHEITKAMEMIAAFRFKKAEGRFASSKIYLGEMEKLLANLSGSLKDLMDPFHTGTKPPSFLTAPLFEKRVIRKKTLVVIAGDKGLCGAYNTNLLRSAAAWLKTNQDFETTLVPVGKISTESYRKKRLPLLASYPEKSPADLSLAKKITEELKSLFLTGKTDSIELLYTTHRPGGTGKNLLLPFLSLSYLMEKDKKKAVQSIEYIYEPDFQSVFESLLSRYLEGKIYITLLESLTSEYSARMIAMKQATDNSEEILSDLKLLRNKTRQATITRELSEIVSGASVLV